MIRLDSTVVLQAVLSGAIATTQPQATVCASDHTSPSTYVGLAPVRTALNSTTDVTILAAPTAGTIRDIDYLSVFNRDTASITVTIKYDATGVDTIITTFTLLTLETLLYVHGAGWVTLAANGAVKMATTVSGILLAVNGGTGFGSYAVGDMLYADTTTTLARLADVAAGSYLRSGGVGVAPLWSTLTLPNSATVGDLHYASATNVISNLADVATGNALISGGIATVPSWGKIGLTTHVSGILPVANGGTSFASYAVGDLLYADTTTTLAKLADVAAGSYLRSGGANTAPVWSTVTLPNSATTGDLLYASATNVYSNLADVASGSYLRSGGVGVAPLWSAPILPTTQVFASGSGTYTKPANCLWIEVEMVGGGGGGAGSGTTPGAAGDGGATTFSTFTANGGAKAVTVNAGAGGTASGGYLNTTGATGQNVTGGAVNADGGHGGVSYFGGNGWGSAAHPGGGGVAAGQGSGGGGGGNAATASPGAGGGAGGYVRAIINSPSATYSYAVGASGTAGTAGTGGAVGGQGAAGVIIVKEFYGP